ncbi:putative glycerol kinase 5 [Cryptotermes secundus]|uniref:Glycerol kinase 5 n=1 Tax=Cryptotermes secundus TaxID=105785 RepID=A0A2J7RN04_9NEOP|nr:putative glycerol kinase 5 isoform X1 [Cryptotermes secundus]PNF42202.1 putative glycerol kinase 5 [Cryptotermes secundus]
MERKYVLALDVGTTTVRCYVLDNSTTVIGKACQEIEHLYPQIGQDEIEPEELWTKSVSVLRDSIKAAGVNPHQIACIGISAQRSSFITWHRETGEPFHNFITWRDLRADGLVQQWNKSLTMKSIRMGALCLYTISRNKRYLAGSVLKLMNAQVTLRLVWVLKNVEALQKAAKCHQAMFGTIDTWLLYRLTGGKFHVTDVSSASATGFYDPFVMEWCDWVLRLFCIPSDMLPEVWDTACDFGCITTDIVEAAIPIRSLVADQAASLFGSCCFEEGDVKVTMGTGTFLNVNTGYKPQASVAGLYPQIGWRVVDEIVFIMEGASHDTGSLINWAQQIGLFSEPTDSADMANSVQNSNGLCFIPAFNGIQVPINNFQAAAGFIGIKPTTSRQHMVRAILESIVFRVVQLYQALLREVKNHYTCIKVDGGVSRNDFVDQLLADLTGLKVERPKSSEMTALGAAFLAGLYEGVWQSKDELRMLRQVDRVFEPRANVCEEYDSILTLWSQALHRFLDWYDT